MTSSGVKHKHVRFASMEDQEEDTLFDKKTDAGLELRSALKATERTATPGGPDRVKVVGGRSGEGSFGRWVLTLSLCGSFLGLGMSISVLGPTFKDLAENVNKDISNISYIFVGRSAGYIGGSLVGGVLFDRMSPHLLLGFSMLLTSLGMYAIPFCRQAAVLTAFMSSIGMTMGVLDTGGNVLILNTWGEHSGPHMQALHFSYAAGAFASPIIAKMLFGHHGNSTHSVHPNTSHSSSTFTVTESMWAYVVISSFVFLFSLFFFVLHSRSTSPLDKPRTSPGRPLVARHHVALVALLFLFFFAYVGAEVAYGSFIFTFATDYAGMSQAEAAGLNSAFWGVFAAARGLAIFFAACLRPGALILLCLVGSTVSSLLLCLFSSQNVSLWVCTSLYGASMATTFPSGISWLEQYTTVTAHTAAVFVVGAALGEMVLPAIVGFLLGKFPHQPLLMYLSLITATFTSILFPVMYKLASAPGSQGSKRADADDGDGEYRQALLYSGGDEEEELN
ncbi:sodium-dependent glucose transporter 1 [Nothobranchius furzeri]|uniref:KIAA1919 n=1 Tax=Nothobranchius furzeri TaxID=105023 RepID=A0A1A8UAW0_NOTFU|nr:major facilitator superfamily domain containing 4B [Nothobranchius furzeri]